MKKLWTALLLIAVLLGLLNAAAVAEKMENVKISDVEYYQPSGCLKGFTLHYKMKHGNASALRVSVQTEQFRDTVDGYSYGDFTNCGAYYANHEKQTDWEPIPSDYGFKAWVSDNFKSPDRKEVTTSLKIKFVDGEIDCSKNQTYHLYLWANYNSRVYPDAFVATFKTGSGKIVSDVIGNDSVLPKGPSNDTSNIPPKAPTNDSSNIPPKGPSNDSSNIPPSNSSNAAQDIPATVDLPKTGDDSQMVLWLAMSLLAGAGLLALTRRRAAER